MAFLCPVRIRRGKKKKSVNGDLDKDLSRPGSGLGLNHGMGRITGSASIETLVRVGIEKEHGLSPDSKMVVLHDFTPCVDDELEVKRGQIVNILYRENDWVYVIGQDSRQEGFIPYSYCTPYNTQLADLAIKKKLPREPNNLPNDLIETSGGTSIINSGNTGGGTGGGSGSNNNSSNNVTSGAVVTGETASSELIDENLNTNGLVSSGNGGGGNGVGLLQSQALKHSQGNLSSSEPDFLPFAKDPSGRYIVLYTFIARDENDVSVERGEFVTVLNREDPDWFWIVRSDGQEGFIPSGFVYPADNVLQQVNKSTSSTLIHQNSQQVSSNNNSNCNLTSPIGNHHMNAINSPLGVNGTGTNTQTQSMNIVNNQQTGSASNTVINHATQAQIVGTDDLRYHGTELVMLYDYKAQAPDDLSVRRGDWIYADLNNQTVDGWLWAYAPKTRKYGFIPKAYARPPAMTSL